MTIFLDKQRPPKKKMGRRQRKGSKSNPATGVQWANWLDIPGSGGGDGADRPTLTSVTPRTFQIDTPTDLVLIGTGFSATSTVHINGVQVTGVSFVSETELHVAAYSYPTPTASTTRVRTDGLPSNIVFGEITAPTPTVTAVDPVTGVQGLASAAVTGTNFYSISTVRLWVGATEYGGVPTTYVSPTSLTFETSFLAPAVYTVHVLTSTVKSVETNHILTITAA